MTDELIRKYAGEIERIIDGNTIGDFTWEGLLFSFLREVDESRTLVEPEVYTINNYSTPTADAAVVKEPELLFDVEIFRYGKKELYAHKVPYEEAEQFLADAPRQSGARIVPNQESLNDSVDDENRFYDVQVWNGMWYDAARHCTYEYANRFGAEVSGFEYRVIDHEPSREPQWATFNLYQ